MIVLFFFKYLVADVFAESYVECSYYSTNYETFVTFQVVDNDEESKLFTNERVPSEAQSFEESLNHINYQKSKGLPAAAFPPSLIGWPGDNNNKPYRLAEIRKQVFIFTFL